MSSRTQLNVVDLKREAGIFAALSSDVRLAIVICLSEQTADLATLLADLNQRWPQRDFERASVVKHLSVLKAAGLIASEERAETKVYRLLAPCLVEAMGCAKPATHVSNLVDCMSVDGLSCNINGCSFDDD